MGFPLHKPYSSYTTLIYICIYIYRWVRTVPPFWVPEMFSICSMYGIYLPIYMKTTNCKLFVSCIYRYSQIFQSHQNAHLSKLGDDDWCHFDAPGRKWFECLELLRAEPFRIAQHGPAQRWTVTSVHGFGVSATHRWCGLQPCAESQCVRQPWWEGSGWSS